PHHPYRLPIRLTAPDGERAERADQLPEPGNAVRFDLRHVVHRPRTGGAERRRVDPGGVVAGDDDAALGGHALLAVDAQPREDLRDRLNGHAPDSPDAVRGRHRRSSTSSAILSTTCSTVSDVVSITTAPGARCVLTASR